MNKALHVLVYVFLALAIAALMFELQLNDKRALLRDRNRMQEDYLVKIAKTVEKSEAPKGAAAELKLDASPVEAKLVDSPDTENVLEEYNAHLEQANLDTFNWEGQRENLRQVYVTDSEGKPAMDGGEPIRNGSPEDKLLATLFDSSKNQLARLNSTRAELVTLRGKLEKVVAMINELKPIARQDKVTIVEKTEKIESLEGEKAELENQITKKNAEIDELNANVTSLRDEVATAQDEVAAKTEELAKSQKLVDQLKKLLIEAAMTRGAQSAQGTITSLTAGNKGRVVEADNENMFAVVEFDEATMRELKGESLDKPIPILELGVKRAGHQGEAGEFVGRVRLRQEIKGKPYIICDILSAWEQDKLQANDTVFAD